MEGNQVGRIEQDGFAEGLTFDDILLIPRESDVLPSDTQVTTRLTPSLILNIPILSSAMDTVTEAPLAIALAQEGGVGVIHKNLSPQDQASEVDKVKRSESGMIVDPITLSPEDRVHHALELMSRFHISGIPITQNGKLVGILTNRDLRFETNLDEPIRNLMTRENLITAPEGIGLEDAKKLLHTHRIEKLPVVDRDNNLKGLITVKDIQKKARYPHACKDRIGRLCVGAAVGVGTDLMKRLGALIDAGVDLVVIDTAHGHSRGVIEATSRMKDRFPQLTVMAGNVATSTATEALFEAGADIVKVGIGPGSICTTRVVAGVGYPQFSAIRNCARIAKKYSRTIVGDGGIRYSGDVTKALAAGASSVMIGSLFAGTDEAPGEMIIYKGRTFKLYRGMGSLGAMKSGSSDRYFQQNIASEKFVPEGIEGRVPYKGPLTGVVHQLVGGVRSGMGYCGARTIDDLQNTAEFVRITSAGYRESHVHDVIITKESPNYNLEPDIT